MGFLSDSARKAYRKGARRTHIPDWFEPAAYVFGVIVGVVLVLGILFADDPEPATTATTAAEPIVIVSDGVSVDDGITGGSTADDGSAATPTDEAATIGDASTGENVTLVDGGKLNLPTGSWQTAQGAVFALLTGNFENVALYPGKTAPIILTTWPEPVILGLVNAEQYPDGTIEFLVRADPDGTGSEAVRDVPIMLARDGATWTYLPG